jgi:hypothetical protein
MRGILQVEEGQYLGSRGMAVLLTYIRHDGKLYQSSSHVP